MANSKITRNCVNCAAEIKLWPSRAKSDRGIYCSRTCLAAFALKTVVCFHCKQPFQRASSQLGRRKRIYCGPQCQFKAMLQPVAARFWAKVNKTDACWLWTGATNGRGYGTLSAHGANRYAHRLSFELHNDSIPEGMEVCHTCDNPPCVNPAHLFLGTHQENMRDMVEKNRNPGKKGVDSPSAKITETQVAEIRRLYEAGVSCRAIGRQFGLNSGHVSRIARRIVWASS